MPIQPICIPSVGTPGYMPVGSDRYPITVTWVSPDLKRIQFRSAKYKLAGVGLCGDQEYEFEDNVDAEVKTARLCKNGHYYTAGGMNSGMKIVPSGKYSAYQDPCF